MEISSPLADRTFRALWLANLVANIGSMIQLVGTSWLMASLGATPQMIALVQAATSLSFVLCSALSGAIADNLDRRKVMLWAQVYLLGVSSCLAVLAYLGKLSPWILLTFTFLAGCGTAMNGPAWQASVGELVPRRILTSAVAYVGMSVNIARSAGPALGGVIVAAFSAAAAFVVNALTTTGLIVALLRWRKESPPRLLPPERLHDAVLAGLRYVAMSPGIRVTLSRALAFGFIATAIPSLMPLVARDLLLGGPLTFGLLLGSFGVGAVGGALASGRIREVLSGEAVIRSAIAATAIAAAMTGLSRTAWITVPFLAVAGASWLLALATFNVSVQLSSPRWVVARAIALYQMATYTGMALGSWTFGWVANHWQISASLLLVSGFALPLLLVTLRRPAAALGKENLDLLERWEAPATAVPVQAQSGPVVITLEHRIAEADVLRFITLMSARRRILLRDGARHWALLRDLADPELWVERYSLPTWLDYRRLISRRTHADQANAEALRQLRIGRGDAVIHRHLERSVGSADQYTAEGEHPSPPRPFQGP